MGSVSSLAEELRTIVGDKHVINGGTALLTYESDALPGYHKKPQLAVFPGTREEALAVVRHLAMRGAPYVPRGAGTGLSGGALAEGVVLLGMQRLKRILSVDPVARRAVVEPGVVNAWLTAAASPYGLHYAPDPSSQTACTIGGNVAENAGGPHCLKYGVTMNHILAATVALPNGDVVTLRTPECPAQGYDLLGAYVGSEGCFGVTLDVTVKLTPNPESIRTLLADFTTVADAAHTVSAIVASGIVPAACELMDQGTIRAVEASIYAAGYPTDAAAVLLVEVDGAAPAVEADAALVERMCKEHGARSVRSGSDPADRARLWQGRKKAFGAMGRVAPTLVVQDAVVPRTRLAEILAEIAAIGVRHQVRICNVFHAGDGNLHPNIPYNGRDAAETARVHAAMREIMTFCIEAGGTITGEHGVGLDKLPYVEQLFTPDTLDAMCRLRSAFDSSRRANPGKVVPVHSCREWNTAALANEREAAPAMQHPGISGTAPRSFAPRGGLGGVERRVVDAIGAARDAGRALHIVGARTGVSPGDDAVTIDVRGHAGVIEYVPGDLTITVGAGMTIEALNAIAGEHNQWCSLFPWGTDAGTVGGALARARGGPARAAFGAARDIALGLTFVDGRSAVVSCGGRVVKNVAGFDLTRTLIGSWGTLGVIVSASLRLRARPPASETWAVPAAAANAIATDVFRRGPLAPAAYEVIPETLAASLGLSREPHVIAWLTGGSAHVAAARAALLNAGPARALDDSVWSAVRAAGPFSSVAAAAGSWPADLNERVRRAFDPAGVFASAAVSSATGLAEVALV